MSLQEILMQRAALHFQNELGPTTGGKPSELFNLVAANLEKTKQEKLAVEQQKKNFEMLTAGGGIGSSNTDSDKIGGLVKSGSYNPVTGETKIIYKTPTPETAAQRATRIKTEGEIEQANSFREDVRSGLSARELGTKYPGMADIIQDNVDIGVISINPQVQQNDAQAVNVVSEDGRIGVTPFDVARQKQNDSVVTERTEFGVPSKTISRSGKIEEGKIETIQKVQETQTKEAVKSIRSFNRIKAAAQGLVGAGKRIVKEQGGFGLKQIITGKIKRGIAKSGFAGDVKPEDAQAGFAEYRGQVKETVLALSPILTNQNRIIQGVVDMLSETLWDPNKPSTSTEFTAQLRQTIKNSYKLSKALNTGALSAEEIRDLNNASPDEIRRQFKQILNKSSWTKEDEADFVEEWKEITSTPATTAEDLFQGGGSIADMYTLN